jgi:hypothetical protein
MYGDLMIIAAGNLQMNTTNLVCKLSSLFYCNYMMMHCMRKEAGRAGLHEDTKFCNFPHPSVLNKGYSFLLRRDTWYLKFHLHDSVGT